jgi:hypothetical protein
MTRVNSAHTLSNGINVINRVPVTAAEEYQVKAVIPLIKQDHKTEVKRVQSSSIKTYDPVSRLTDEPVKANDSEIE